MIGRKVSPLNSLGRHHHGRLIHNGAICHSLRLLLLLLHRLVKLNTCSRRRSPSWWRSSHLLSSWLRHYVHGRMLLRLCLIRLQRHMWPIHPSLRLLLYLLRHRRLSHRQRRCIARHAKRLLLLLGRSPSLLLRRHRHRLRGRWCHLCRRLTHCLHIEWIGLPLLFSITYYRCSRLRRLSR